MRSWAEAVRRGWLSDCTTPTCCSTTLFEGAVPLRCSKALFHCAVRRRCSGVTPRARDCHLEPGSASVQHGAFHAVVWLSGEIAHRERNHVASLEPVGRQVPAADRLWTRQGGGRGLAGEGSVWREGVGGGGWEGVDEGGFGVEGGD